MQVRTDAIVIDIDNTITHGEYPFLNDYELCAVAEGAKEAIDSIRKEYLVILNTGRHINHAIMTIKWLKKHKINYDHIQFGKPPAVAYIDDKGVKHKSWKNTMNILRKGNILKNS